MQWTYRLFLAWLCGLFLLAAGCASSERDAKSAPQTGDKSGEPTVKIEELREGTGEGAKLGDYLQVHYTGWLMDGTKFDSSLDHPNQEPFTLRLGKGQVIPGWEKGLEGMKAGGKRRLVIPPGLAYGPRGNQKIPGNSTLVFELELVSIK